MVLKYQDYRSYLKEELARRNGKNRAFSLRAMAKFFNVAPSLLSDVLKGKKNISYDTAVKIASKLKLTRKESEYFCELVRFEAAKNVEVKGKILERVNRLGSNRQVVSLAVDSFQLLADWYHLPIRQLSLLKGFKLTPQNVSKKLGIAPIQAEVALERLTRLGLLAPEAQGQVLVKSEAPNPGLREFHRQMLQKAIESLEAQTPQQKKIGSETLAFDLGQLEEAGEIIEEFFDRMVRLSESGRNKTHVYHLGVQFFDLTKGEKK